MVTDTQNSKAGSAAVSAEQAAKVIPRAEFRVFGQNLIDAVQEKMWAAGATLQQARRMPEETYFIARLTNDANVKVRAGLLDIKVKVGETAEGYEIFQPRGKFQFPVKQVELTAILAFLKTPMSINRETVGFDEFLAITRAHPDLVPVRVEKMRYGFTVEGVICEFARVWFNGALMETACCESEHYAQMKKVIEVLGIAAMPNTSYLRAAKRVIGMD